MTLKFKSCYDILNILNTSNLPQRKIIRKDVRKDVP